MDSQNAVKVIILKANIKLYGLLSLSVLSSIRNEIKTEDNNKDNLEVKFANSLSTGPFLED